MDAIRVRPRGAGKTRGTVLKSEFGLPIALPTSITVSTSTDSDNQFLLALIVKINTYRIC